MYQYYHNIKMSTIYNGHICYSTPQTLFAGKKNVELDIWEQEPLENSIAKLRDGIESLGVTFVSVEFGNYDEVEGTLEINELLCRCTGDKKMLEELLNFEVYIRTGISHCIECPTYKRCVFYFTVRR